MACISLACVVQAFQGSVKRYPNTDGHSHTGSLAKVTQWGEQHHLTSIHGRGSAALFSPEQLWFAPNLSRSCSLLSFDHTVWVMTPEPESKPRGQASDFTRAQLNWQVTSKTFGLRNFGVGHCHHTVGPVRNRWEGTMSVGGRRKPIRKSCICKPRDCCPSWSMDSE